MTNAFANMLLPGEENEEKVWQAILWLRENGSREVFDSAAAWCASGEPLQRQRGADVLNQLREPAPLDPAPALGPPNWLFRSESFDVLNAALARETDAHALASEISALSSTRVPAAVPVMLEHAAHADDGVRWAVTYGMTCFPEEEIAIQTLLRLTIDVTNTSAIGRCLELDRCAPRTQIASAMPSRGDSAIRSTVLDWRQ